MRILDGFCGAGGARGYQLGIRGAHVTGMDIDPQPDFELHDVAVPQPLHGEHRGRVSGMRHGEWFEGPYFAVYGEGGGKGSAAQWREAMGIDWTWERKSIAEAIPPAFTQYIGWHL